MTDRHAGYLVALEKDIREDDAARVVEALGMVKGVLSVVPVVGDPVAYIAKVREGNRWQQALLGLLEDMEASP